MFPRTGQSRGWLHFKSNAFRNRLKAFDLKIVPQNNIGAYGGPGGMADLWWI
jgi:hypothetical protein